MLGRDVESSCHDRALYSSRPSSCATPRLRQQHQLAGRLATVEVGVGLARLVERVGVLNPQLQLAVRDPAEDVASPLDQLVATLDVNVEARPGQVEAAFGVENLWVQRCHGAAGLPEQHHHAAWTDDVESLV